MYLRMLHGMSLMTLTLPYFCFVAGAAQPEYTITADDCDNMVAIECVPMDERGRRVRGRHD